MRSRIPAFLATALLLAAVATPAARAAHRAEVRNSAPNVSVSDSVDIPEGEVHNDDVVVIFGDARVEGKVNGDVVVVMGSYDIQGEVTGTVVGVFAEGAIGEEAQIGEDLVNVGGSLDRAPEARVGGEVVNLNAGEIAAPLREGLPGLARLFYMAVLIKLFFLFMTLTLIAALVPGRLTVMARTFPQRWLPALLVGLATFGVTFVVLVILTVTVIGIPLALGLYAALFIVKCLGLSSILYLTGHTAGRNLFHKDLAHFPAMMGGFALFAVLSVIPVFAFFFFFIVAPVLSALGTGIAILTRFGSEDGWRRAGQAGGQVATAAPGVPPIIQEN